LGVLVVYKYPLSLDGRVVELELPEGAEPLCVGLQFREPMLWARVETNKLDHRLRRFRIAGTGHPNADGKYLGSLLIDEGSLVFHVFDLGLVEIDGARQVSSTADDEYVQHPAREQR
jgi:hypothetical protein